MRIEPIRDGREARSFSTRDRIGPVACRPAFLERNALGSDRKAFCGLAGRDINQVLLKRAFAGLLSRLRSFDWEVIHGHNVGATDRGAFLDVRA